MKGLILSITAGQGHNQTAKVLSDYFNKEGISCSYMDVFEYINPLLSESVSKIYLASSKNIPKVYGKIDRFCEKRPNEDSHGVPKLTTQILARKLARMINTESPDFIICTHVFAALLITGLEGAIDKRVKTYGIITDFTIHPYWEDTTLDYYVTPSDILTYQGKRRGLLERKFLPFGIPIDTKFETKMEKRDALKVLKLPEKKTILMMSGSMGFGDIAEEIEVLDRMSIDFQLITVCGNNKKLKVKIDELKTRKEVYNYGYVDNVDVMMDAADCIITKPGGLTTSEALAKELPMIMSNPVPGQEDRNVEFLLNAGAAIKVSKTYTIDDAVNHMFTKDRMELIKSAINILKKPYATRDLVQFIINEIEKNNLKKIEKKY